MHVFVFFNAIASVKKKNRIGFYFDLRNTICDQCNRKCSLIYLFLVHSYVAVEIKKKEKIEENVTMGLKVNFSNHWLMVRLNSSSDNVRNCEETTTFVKDCEKIIKCKKK